ncbi:hypothetical protein GEU84_016865 [Fertoebacter nigrum]|uniref:Uncharacterized protein n=1 Tax=Fertoeibacter niger TaxID=2656921 RepID=A0A8X8KS58_9RHOB|nr:DUF6338 family protein [Fertoeibacter niger]NUB46072.1 hypothetical protein [Fertoeibacter niger]
MPDIFKPDTFDFFARYFLAGFILASVRARYVIGEKPRSSDVIYEAVILSLLNQLIFQSISAGTQWFRPALIGSPVADWLYQSGEHFAFQLEILLLPAVLGLLSGLILRMEWNTPILTRLAMPIIHPTVRAYDYAFGDITTDRFVIITYADGTMIYGYFGENSLASSASDRGDIYIERLYDVYEGVWTPTVPPKSALLLLKDLRSIEFIEPERETDDGT